MKTLKHIAMCIAAVLAVSCVSQKKYQQLEAQNAVCISDGKRLSSELDGCRKENEARHKTNQGLQANIDALHDTIAHRKSEQTSLQNRYSDLLREQETLQKGSRAEIRQLMEQLQANRDALQKREDELAAAERAVSERTAAANKLEQQTQQQQAKLYEQQDKLRTFERILREKDSVASALKQKVADALLGFADKGLSVHLRNGKVYVSMTEKLLFASGKFEVDKQGAAALKNLAEILEKNPDINILIEGHTDDVPFPASGQLADNWDLSCKRATSVVRILLSGKKIDSSRITAAGRAEFVPVRTEKTTEARTVNRRIEVVLSPKLDEVLKILED
jgi:chemotaxis protein MotB